MPKYRGVEGAAIIAKKAYAAYGWEATPEIIDAFYAALRGRRFKQALAAVERCFLHEDRTKPPSCSEVLGEYLRMDREVAREAGSEAARSRYSEGRPLTPMVFHGQVIEAKQKYPHLFDGSSGFDMTELTEQINAMLRRGGPISLPVPPVDYWEPKYAPEADYDDDIPF